MVQASGKQQSDTKDRILDAAEDVFCRKGYSKTTLNDIAQAAGMTRGAIYWNFKNKEDLVRQMADRVVRPIKEQVEQIVLKGSEDPITALKKIHAMFVHGMATNVRFQKVATIALLKAEQTAETDYIGILLAEWREFMGAILRNFLEKARKKGLLPEKLDVEMAANMLYYVFWGMVRAWLLDPTKFDIEEYGWKQEEALYEMLQLSTSMRIS